MLGKAVVGVLDRLARSFRASHSCCDDEAPGRLSTPVWALSMLGRERAWGVLVRATEASAFINVWRGTPPMVEVEEASRGPWKGWVAAASGCCCWRADEDEVGRRREVATRAGEMEKGSAWSTWRRRDRASPSERWLLVRRALSDDEKSAVGAVDEVLGRSATACLLSPSGLSSGGASAQGLLLRAGLIAVGDEMWLAIPACRCGC